MNKRTRLVIALVSNIILFLYGVYRLIIKDYGSISFWIPIILAVGGLIGFISTFIELRKLKNSSYKSP